MSLTLLRSVTSHCVWNKSTLQYLAYKTLPTPPATSQPAFPRLSVPVTLACACSSLNPRPSPFVDLSGCYSLAGLFLSQLLTRLFALLLWVFGQMSHSMRDGKYIAEVFPVMESIVYWKEEYNINYVARTFYCLILKCPICQAFWVCLDRRRNAGLSNLPKFTRLVSSRVESEYSLSDSKPSTITIVHTCIL